MMEAILYSALVVGSFFLGMMFREWLAMRKVQRYMQLIDDVQEKIKQATVRVHIVKDKGMFFLYNLETNEFLAQGTTHEEIQEVLNKRFPDKCFDADAANLKEVGYPIK